MKKSVTSKNVRPLVQQRIAAALAKKPSASDASRRGLTPEQAAKLFRQGRQEVKLKSNTMGGIKHRSDTRPHAVGRKPDTYDPNAITSKLWAVPDWFASDGAVDVSIIIPLYRSRDVVGDQVRSWDLGADDGLTKEIIYVDDACPDRSYEQVFKWWEIRRKDLGGRKIGSLVKNSGNAGYAGACNAGARHAKGKYLVFLNADTAVTPGWVRPMIDLLVADENIGIVGNLQTRHGRCDSAGSEWSWRTRAFEHIGRNVYNNKPLAAPMMAQEMPPDLLEPAERDMVTGCCFAIPKSLFDKAGGFDPQYRVGYWEDADLNMRVRSMGYKVYYQPRSVITHRLGHSGANGHPYLAKNRERFHARWVETKLLDGLLGGCHTAKLDIPQGAVAVYTAITHGYDGLKEQPEPLRRDGVEFVAFLERQVPSGTWSFRPLHGEFADPNRNAKIHKILPHVYFPDKQYSLWVDGSVDMVFPFPVHRLIEIYLGDADMALFRHPDRNCLYQEASVCIQRRLDDERVIEEQVKRYTRDNYPSNIGLVEATVLLRRHTPKIREFNEAWWAEIQRGSKRDQISFNYVARKMGVKYNYFPGSLRRQNYLFKRHLHNHNRK